MQVFKVQSKKWRPVSLHHEIIKILKSYSSQRQTVYIRLNSATATHTIVTPTMTKAYLCSTTQTWCSRRWCSSSRRQSSCIRCCYVNNKKQQKYVKNVIIMCRQNSCKHKNVLSWPVTIQYDMIRYASIRSVVKKLPASSVYHTRS